MLEKYKEFTPKNARSFSSSSFSPYHAESASYIMSVMWTPRDCRIQLTTCTLTRSWINEHALNVISFTCLHQSSRANALFLGGKRVWNEFGVKKENSVTFRLMKSGLREAKLLQVASCRFERKAEIGMCRLLDVLPPTKKNSARAKRCTSNQWRAGKSERYSTLVLALRRLDGCSSVVSNILIASYKLLRR